MKRAFVLAHLFLVVTLLSCEEEEPKTPPSADIILPFHADYDITALDFTEAFSSSAVSRGQVQDFDEVSGLANSIKNPSYLWMHEDSGADSEIALLSKAKAKSIVTYKITDAQNMDWEDIAVATDVQNSSSYIYLADIGDNQAQRSYISAYKIAEPKYDGLDSGKVLSLSGSSQLKMVYPSGARDAEAFMVDPITNDILLVTKRESRVELYGLAYPQKWGGLDTLEFLGSFPFTGVTAGDISADGNAILLRTYSAIFYWERIGDQPLSHLLASQPLRAPYNPTEWQGEAICWDGDAYFTLSEKIAGVVPKLYYYSAK